jgi:hypothetical protein
MPQLWPNNTLYKWNTVSISLLEPGWYDGVLLYAQAIADVLNASLPVTGPNLLAAVQNRNNRFTGASGLWSWDTNYDRLQDFDV